MASLQKLRYIDPVVPLNEALKVPFSQRTFAQKNTICDFLRAIQTFKRFTTRTLISISNHLKYHKFEAEQTMDRDKNKYYIVISGLFYFLSQDLAEDRD